MTFLKGQRDDPRPPLPLERLRLKSASAQSPNVCIVRGCRKAPSYHGVCEFCVGRMVTEQVQELKQR